MRHPGCLAILEVREAIRTLSTLDIVDVRHGHGTYVGPMSLDPMVEALVFREVLSPDGSLEALREVVEVRLALDLAMADRVVAGTHDADGDGLAALVAEMVDKAERGEPFLEQIGPLHPALRPDLEPACGAASSARSGTCTRPCSRSWGSPCLRTSS